MLILNTWRKNQRRGKIGFDEAQLIQSREHERFYSQFQMKKNSLGSTKAALGALNQKVVPSTLLYAKVAGPAIKCQQSPIRSQRIAPVIGQNQSSKPSLIITSKTTPTVSKEKPVATP